MGSIVDVLMERDGLTEDQAIEEITIAREEMMNMLENGNLEDAYYICEDMFGLEPDYLMNLI
jgi:hypothetical protein